MDFGNDSQKTKVIEWTDTLEDYFAKIGEKAQGYSLLHKQAEALYSYRTTLIDLPVIILSTVCGTLSIGGANIFPTDWVEGANQVVGALSIGVGVLNTVGTYFAWSKRAEAHRVSSLQYARMSRFLRVELQLPREERMNCAELLKMIRTDWERLTEISPILPDNLIGEFRRQYQKRSVSKPDEIHGIEPIRIFNTQPKKNLKDLLAINLNALKSIGQEQNELHISENIKNKLAQKAESARNSVHMKKVKSFRRSHQNDLRNFRQAANSDTDDDTPVNAVGINDLEMGVKNVLITSEPNSPRPFFPSNQSNSTSE